MNSISRTIRVAAISMAFLMFFTSVDFTLDMHYCQSQLKPVSFFGKAKTCHEMADTSSMKNCSHHQKMIGQKEGCSEDKKCCSGKTFHFQSDQDQQKLSSDFLANHQISQFVVASASENFINSLSIGRDSNAFIQYTPPLILRDIPVLVQSFLI